MAKSLALFSGQGSQYPGMGKDLYDNFPKAREVYERAGDLFHFDVAKTSFTGTEEELAGAKVSQPVIFTHSVAAYTVAKEELPQFQATAGYSLGEYASLWCAGAYDLDTAMKIIYNRTDAMEMAAAARPGTMYAIMGGEPRMVHMACSQAKGDVWPVNYNLPTQTVISGDPEACARAVEILTGQGLKATKLNVSGAFHSPYMEPAARWLSTAVLDYDFSEDLAMDFYSNLSGNKHEVGDYPEHFSMHMTNPVRFVAQVEAMARDGIAACVEFGPKKTSSTLVKKNNKDITAVHVEDTKSLKKAIEAMSAL